MLLYNLKQIVSCFINHPIIEIHFTEDTIMSESGATAQPRKTGKEKTNWKTGAFYGLGEVGSQLSWYMINTYLTIFYTDIVGLSAAAISAIMLIARIWDAINDPMMGAIADRTHTRWGRFRPYILFGPPFLAVFNLLTFTVFPMTGLKKVIVCLICYIGAGMSYTAVNICYCALVNVIAKDSQTRMDYASCRGIGNGIISMILSAVAMPLILFFGKSTTPNAHGYFMTALCCSLCMIPCFWLCGWKCKETVGPSMTVSSAKKNVFETLGKLFKNKYLLITVFTVFTGAMGSMARMSMLTFYVIYVVGNPMMVAPIFSAMTICQLIGNFTLPWGTRVFSKKGYLILTSVIQIAGMILMFLIPADNSIFLIGISALIGFTMCNGNISTGMLSDCIEYGDWKFGIREEGLTYSFISFAAKLATAVTGSVTVLMLAKIGYIPNAEQTASVKTGINALVNLFPAILIGFSTIAVLFYRLSPKKMDQIYTDLAARNKE